MSRVKKHRQAAHLYKNAGLWDLSKAHNERANELEFGVKRHSGDSEESSPSTIPLQRSIQKPQARESPGFIPLQRSVPVTIEVRLYPSVDSSARVTSDAKRELQSSVEQHFRKANRHNIFALGEVVCRTLRGRRNANEEERLEVSVSIPEDTPDIPEDSVLFLEHLEQIVARWAGFHFPNFNLKFSIDRDEIFERI